MKEQNKYIITLILFLLISNVLHAQKMMSLEECREQAIVYNKQLKKATYQINEAEAQVKAAKTAYLPSISADANYMRLFDMDDVSTPGGFLPTAESEAAALNGEFSGLSDVWMPGTNIELGNMSVFYGGLSVSQPLYAGGKIIASNKMAGAGLDIANLSYDLKYGDVIELTDKAFWSIAMVEANIGLANKYIEMLADLEETMIAMYELGLQPASERLRVSVQKNEADLQLMIIKNNLKIAKMNLNQILGNALEDSIHIVYDSLANLQLIDLSNGSSLAMMNRNELYILKKQVEISEYDKNIIAADYLPQLGVGFQYMGNYVDNFREELTFTPILAAQLTIPIFQWGQGHHRRKAAEFKIRQNETELSRTTDLINLEVAQVKVRVEEAYEVILIAKKNIIEAEESLSETKSSFDVGLNSTTDLLNAQGDWLNARAHHILAIAQYKILETSWEKVTGQLAPIK